MSDEPIKDALEDMGVYVERREAGVVPQLLGSAAGSIVGQILAGVVRLGPVGRIVGMLGGAIVGQLAVTHRIRYEPSRGDSGPESPAKHSDRR